MNRPARIAAGLLLIWVALAIYWLRGVQQVARVETEHSEARARREITQSAIPETTAAPVKVRLYRIAAGGVGLEPVEIEIALASDAGIRARQLVAALAALDPPPGGERTLPPDTALLEFYLLPEGAAVADFSDALATALPSGILSEQLTLDAVTRTLAENIPQLRRMKIVIAGQEAETLAGHIDLTGFFELNEGAAGKAEKPAAGGGVPR